MAHRPSNPSATTPGGCASDRWAPVDGDGPSTRGSPALGYDEARATFVLYGGFDSNGGLLDDTWEWADGWRCVAGC